MKKNNLLFLLLILIGFSNRNYGQELFSKIPIEVTNVNSKKTISVVDNENNIYLFFIDNTKIRFFKTNKLSKTHFESSFESNDSNAFIFDKPRGYTITNDNRIILYFSDSWHKKFTSVLIPKEKNGDYKTKSFKIKNNKEKHLFYAEGENEFYIYTYIKNSSILKRYVIQEDIKDVIDVDLSKERFYDRENKICKLSDILKFNKPSVIKRFRKTSKDSISLPSSIDISSKKVKVFVSKNNHLITLNHKKSATRTIELNPKNDKTNLNYFSISTRDFNTSEAFKIRANSFVFKNILYQFICSNKQINLSAFHLKTGEFIRGYKFNKKDDLTIMNSNIIQKGSLFNKGKKTVIAKTSQFLRTLAKSDDVGIHVYERDNVLNLSIGGTSEIKVPLVSVVLASTSIGMLNISFGAFISYKTNKSIYINCLFDENNFEHVEGRIQENIFDRIIRYSKYLKDRNEIQKLSLESLFKYDNYFLQGYYDRKSNQYFLRKHK